MNRYTVNMIRHWLGDAVTQLHTGPEAMECSKGICFLDESLDRLDAGSLYIGTPEQLAWLLREDRLGDTEVFAVLCAGQSVPEPLPPTLTLFRTDLQLTSLYNRLHRHVHRYNEWIHRLEQAVFQNEGLQKLLDIASEELRATVQITNPGYKYIAGFFHPDIQDERSLELMHNGYHSYESIQLIRKEKPCYTNHERGIVEYVSAASGYYNLVRLIRYKSILVARLCIMLSGPEPDPYERDLSETVAEYIAKSVLSNQGADYSRNAELGTLVADLIEGRLYNPDELDQRLKQVKLSVRRYYYLVLVRINNADDQGLFPWNYIMSQIQQAFRYCDATTYRGDILLLARKTQRGSRPSFNQEMLQQVLEQYNGRVVISNASEYMSSMAPLYNQIKGVMRIASRMDPQRRIYYFEEYSIYQIVEMAADTEVHHLGSRNLAHLCNNELIALVLYDKKNNTNLADMLFVYLSNERNMTLTAKVMYMHRNTLLYKIRKIEEVIGCTLDDPILRERILFSYRVLTYMGKYLGDDILKLRHPTKREKDRETSGTGVSG